MQFKKTNLFLLIVGLILSTVQAFAACPSMSLSNINSYTSLNSNSFPALDVQVNKGSGNCSSFFVVIDNGGASSYTNRVIQSNFSSYPIQFFKDSARNQILKSEFEASPSEVISGAFGGGTSTFNAVYYAYINTNASQYISSGNYSKNFILKLYEGDLGNRILRDSKVVQFTYSQYKTVDISLVSTGSAFNLTNTSQSIDFGKLTEGSSRGFDIVLLYNAGYTVSMSSTNAGKLKHLTARKFVPYSFSLDGAPVTLTSVSSVVKNASGVSPPNGTRLPVNIKIGTIVDSIPGTYTDTITINVAASE